MTLEIPHSLHGGHESLRATLRQAMREEGPLGEVARRLAQVIDGHMMREEKFVLRPLGILKALARGDTPADLADAQHLAEGLPRALPQMMDEHRQVAELVPLLAREAEAAGRLEFVAFAEELLLHARLEEEVLYPAALLVGRYATLVRGG